ncbi:polymorphic toxin-type HINT domain-containing protein [Frankia sp. Cr2]|uniref:polymorphic toxin-type HINT domain-containing protein n=1 Tax=Frankia sp. Cr2 TaxID=3073932 RepID=UPI002AD21240|nr:polymorphic toxin-type HINT domain-containing protein [Frankia sp. Cr2]
MGEGDKALVEVTVRTADGDKVIVATDGHPFWVESLGRWVAARDVASGALLRTSAGTFVQVGVVRTYAAHQRVYNLTVDDLHTYYVLAGTTRSSSTILGHIRSGRHITRILVISLRSTPRDGRLGLQHRSGTTRN